MIEVVIDSIRVSLMTQHRVVILKDANNERYLPIWIGPFEADAITMELQELPPPRPLTHDLLKAIIDELGGKVAHVFICDLRKDVFYARLVIEANGKQIEIDSRPSDAVALAVRVKAPVFVDESVMERAGIEPEKDVEHADAISGKIDSEAVDEDRLSAFADFVNTLDLDDLGDKDN